MTHYNSGDVFRRRFESDYNAIRRFYVANPGIRPHDLINPVTGRATRQSKSDAITSAQTKHYWDNHRWLYRDCWRYTGIQVSKERDIKRQCPQCAQALFHSHAYTISWITKCPVHHTPFTDTCPECHQPWPNYLEIPDRPCTTCGVGKPGLSSVCKQRSEDHCDNDVAALEAIWKATQISQNYTYVIYEEFVEHPPEVGRLAGHNIAQICQSLLKRNQETKDIVHYQIAAHPDKTMLDMFLNFDYVIMTQAFSVESMSSDEMDAAFQSKTGRMPRRLSRLIDAEIKLANEAFNLDPEKIKQSPVPFVDFLEDYNPLEVSMMIWLDLVRKKPVPHRRQWWERILDLQLRRLPSFPSCPAYMYERKTHRFYRPPVEFSCLLTQLHMKAIFIYIHSCVVCMQHIMKYKNFPNGRDEIVYESYDGGSHNGFHDFRIFLDGETSAVFAYKPQEEWSGLLSGDKIRNSAAPIQNMLNNGSFRRQVYLSNSDSFTDTVKKELSSYTANHKEDSIVTGEHHVIVRNYPL